MVVSDLPETVLAAPAEPAKTIGKPFGGIPTMPPDYWEYWSNETPLFKMGKPERPKTWIVGFNGARGGGKSGSAAYVAASERLLRGIPVYTIPESYYIRVPVIWNGKIYLFHSEPMEIERLLGFDETLRGCAVLADEANIQLADSHRTMSNKNLGISDYAQQARHLETSFFYTVISPTWIDPRLRQLTDVLIYCSDCANSASGEEAGLEEGEYCNWSVTDNSGMLTGVPYEVEAESFPWYFRLKDFWEIYDSHNIADSQKARRNVEYTNNKIQIQIQDNPQTEAYNMLCERIESVMNTYAKSPAADREMSQKGEVLMPTSALWNTVGIGDELGLQTVAGTFIKNSLGIAIKTKGHNRYYDLTPLVMR